MADKPFYNHIAGLRGIAIVLVFLFHLCATTFPHGFYGVDIFLVISGYLLFLSFSRNGNHLDLKSFASKKLFRIFPPMILLILLTIAAGVNIQDCEDIITLSRTGRYTLFGFANTFLSESQTDYFAADALNNPLLHMWYLSVTIQLYIIFAAGCIAYRFLPGKLVTVLLWLLGIASFCYGYSYQLHNILQALNLPVWQQHTAISHYYTIPRIWEALAGGAILLLPLTENKSKATMLTFAGLLAVLLPSFIADGIADYGAPVVVLGTMLIIRYMPDSSLMPLLSNKLLVWVGSISFSLYLVHMPVITYITSWNMGSPDRADYTIITVLSITLAWLFWFLVEKRRINIYATIALWGIAMAICVLGKEKKGFKDYIYPEINNIRVAPYNEWKFCAPETLSNHLDKEKLKYNNGAIRLTKTTRKEPKKPTTPLMQLGPESPTPRLLLIGDSHAQAAYSGMNQLCTELNIPGVFLSSIILPNWDLQTHLDETYFYNKDKAESLLRWLEANPSITHVFIGQFWRTRLQNEFFVHWDSRKEPMNAKLYQASLREFLLRIKSLKRNILLIGPAPEIISPDPCRYIRLHARKGITDINLKPLSCTKADFEKQTKDVIPMLKAMEDEGLCTVLWTADFIQDNKPFVAYQDGRFLTTDSDHLSSAGSIELFNYLKPQIEKAFSKATSE